MRVTSLEALIWRINGIDNRATRPFENATIGGCLEELKYLTKVDLGPDPKKWLDLLEELGIAQKNWSEWAEKNPEYTIKE